MSPVLYNVLTHHPDTEMRDYTLVFKTGDLKLPQIAYGLQDMRYQAIKL